MIVLVAVDFTPVTGTQLQAVRELWSGRPDRIYLLHVAEPDPDFVGFEAGPAVVRDQMAAKYRREHERLQELADDVRRSFPDVVPLLVQGAIVETILQEAEKLKAGLVVVGHHGRGATFSLIAGSVLPGLARGSSVPILVVPAASKGMPG